MAIIGTIVLWLVMAAAADHIAFSKGRSGCLFQLFALMLPLIALLVAIGMAADQDALDARAVKDGDKRKCPACAEVVAMDAKICRYCRAELEPPPPKRMTGWLSDFR